MTIGAYLAINYLRLKIPEDISVIGFDNFPLANVVNPPLSFAEQPTNLMGTEAGKLLPDITGPAAAYIYRAAC